MAAIGTVFIYFIYALIGGYIVYWTVRYFTVTYSTLKLACLRKAGIGSFLFLCFAGNNYQNHKNAEAEYVGIYTLTSYPNCAACRLYIEPDNYYEVRESRTVKERGEWRYESGGDYWIVYVNEDEQLGVGNYSYSDKSQQL
jgi:hypothetical protein